MVFRYSLLFTLCAVVSSVFLMCILGADQQSGERSVVIYDNTG